MITAKGSFDDMRQGFLSGSDDYMVKPVNVNEMVLRVGALLRRAQILSEHKIVIGSTEFDYDAMTVMYHPFGMFLFGRIVLRLPYPFVFQFIRQELLFDEIAFVAVGIGMRRCCGQTACAP